MIYEPYSVYPQNKSDYYTTAKEAIQELTNLLNSGSAISQNPNQTA